MRIANRFGIATRRAGRRGAARGGIALRILAGASLGAAAFGCLPDPQITVPDFGPSTSTADMTMPPRLDGPGMPNDLGTGAWVSDGNTATKEPLRGCWAADAMLSSAYAVGNNGAIVRRTGGTWQLEVAKDGMADVKDTLYAVSASAADQVFAVGDRGVIVRRASDKWNREGKELGLTSALYGVTVLTNGEVIAVGDNGVIARRKIAGTWALEPMDVGLSRASFRAVWGNTDGSLVAVGMGAAIARYDMGQWSFDTATIDAADRGNYYAVAGTPEGLFVAGDYGRVLRQMGTKWVRETVAEQLPKPPMPVFFFGLGAVQGDLFVVGTFGLIERRDAMTKAWQIEQIAPSGITTALYGVAGTGQSGRPVLAVGSDGVVLRRN